MAKKIFVNLPLRNIKKSTDFFARQGFTFNTQFADGTADCMIISEGMYVMLLTEIQNFHSKTNLRWNQERRPQLHVRSRI